MKKLVIPEHYQNPTRQPVTTPIYDPWAELPYAPKHDCPACKGAGFVHPVVEGVIKYNKIVPCRAARCILESMRAGQPRARQEQTFETFEKVRGTEQSWKAATLLAYGEAKFVWLLFYGGVGSGKTHLCNAMVNVLHDRGLEVRIILAADLFAMLREAMRDNRTDETLRGYKEVGFLIIDDYGVEYGSDWERAKFDELMTSRYALALPTVLTTNKELTQLPERIQSRFTDKEMSRAIYNEADDYRQRS